MSGPTSYRLGVGIVLINHSGLIFAGCRRDGRVPPWQMPQGGVLPGEMPEQAAMRELSEELGTLKAEILDAFPGWIRYNYPAAQVSPRSGAFRGQQHRWFLMRFDGTDGDIRIETPHPEFCAWQWMTPADLIRSVASFKRRPYRQVFAYFAPAIERSIRSMPPAGMDSIRRLLRKSPSLDVGAANRTVGVADPTACTTRAAAGATSHCPSDRT